MRNINTWLLFVFLLRLASTGGEKSGGQETEEEEEVEEVELARSDAPDDDDDVGDRERRGLYGGSEKEEVCPKQCLCLSEIQVIMTPQHTKLHHSYNLNSLISQVLCNTGNITQFPRKLPNVTQDISITNQNIKMIPKYVSHASRSHQFTTLGNNIMKPKSRLAGVVVVKMQFARPSLSKLI